MKRTKPLSECRILCTPATFGKRDPSLRSDLEAAVREVIYNPLGRPLKAADLHPLVTDIDGYIAGLDEIDASVIHAADRLRVIARYGVGFDQVDIRSASARGIVVTNTPGANSAAVAELTIGFLLCLSRKLVPADEAVRRGEWPPLDGIGIRGKTVGLIGFGSVGREVARRLACFGCRVLAVDPLIRPEVGEEFGVRLVSLEELVAQADFVSLHTPATASTVGMIDESFLQRMKKGAFLINTARGELVDEPALVRALEKGHVQGAALDCFSREPPETANPLLRLPNVIVTPHIGAHTDEALNQMGRMAVSNCLAALQGERPSHIVNPEVWDRRGAEESDVPQ